MKTCHAPVQVRLSTPSATGAIAIIDVQGDIDSFFVKISMPAVAVGEVKLRDLMGVDTGLVARWSDTFAQLMPHGGVRITNKLLEALHDTGAKHIDSPDDTQIIDWYPEAQDIHEARMLNVLSRASSMRTVELLLDQPARWRSQDTFPSIEIEKHSRALNRLLMPPMVVLLGEPNIGKSTLTNALAQQSVSIVSVLPGTTRDHVGVELLLDGLAVRWIDTPGLPDADAPHVEREASRMSMEFVRVADLLLLCADASTSFPDWDAAPNQQVLRVGLRADLGPIPQADIEVAAGEASRGVPELARVIRECLVPDESFDWTGPWRFWDEPQHCSS